MARARRLLAVALAAGMVLAPAAEAAAAPKKKPTAVDHVLAYINKARKAHRLKPLKLKPGLTKAATYHGKWMLKPQCGLTHQCAGEPTLGRRLTMAHVTWSAAGENIGYRGPARKTVKAIANSAIATTRAMLAETPPNDGHRRALLNPGYSRIGLWVHRDKKGIVWIVQDFAN
ncbi:hypothetical protein GCM10027589_27790 [Actinocorallia lasiicapitis]